VIGSGKVLKFWIAVETGAVRGERLGFGQTWNQIRVFKINTC